MTKTRTSATNQQTTSYPLTKKQKQLIAELVNEVIGLCLITYGLAKFEQMRDMKGLFGALGKFQRILTLVEFGTYALEYIDSNDPFHWLNAKGWVNIEAYNGLEPVLTYFLTLIRTQRIPPEFQLFNQCDHYTTSTAIRPFLPTTVESRNVPRFSYNQYRENPAFRAKYLDPTVHETTTFQQEEYYVRIAHLMKKILLLKNTKAGFQEIISPSGFMGTEGAFVTIFTKLSIVDIFYSIESHEYTFISVMLVKIINILAQNKKVKAVPVKKTAFEVMFRHDPSDPSAPSQKKRIEDLKLAMRANDDRLKKQYLAIQDAGVIQRAERDNILKEEGEKHAIEALLAAGPDGRWPRIDSADVSGVRRAARVGLWRLTDSADLVAGASVAEGVPSSHTVIAFSRCEICNKNINSDRMAAHKKCVHKITPSPSPDAAPREAGTI